MSEYWKSTPKYWCKHCRTYVRDTPLEKRNHEATLTHQNGVKRALRDIHRGHEQTEREKERAAAEVARLNGLVSGSGSGSRAAGGSVAAGAVPRAREGGDEAQRKRQLEELAGLGVAMPGEVRGGMAMAGEWTVTSTKVIEEKGKEEKEVGAKALGVRKREVTEQEKEEEEAVRGLFKKRKGWGRDVKGMPGEGDRELDELLRSDLVGSAPVKKEVKAEDDEVEVKKEGGDEVKAEAGEGVKREETEPAIKSEPADEPSLADTEPANEPPNDAAPAPVFKKRKAKNIRQK